MRTQQTKTAAAPALPAVIETEEQATLVTYELAMTRQAVVTYEGEREDLEVTLGRALAANAIDQIARARAALSENANASSEAKFKLRSLEATLDRWMATADERRLAQAVKDQATVEQLARDLEREYANAIIAAVHARHQLDELRREWDRIAQVRSAITRESPNYATAPRQPIGLRTMPGARQDELLIDPEGTMAHWLGDAPFPKVGPIWGREYGAIRAPAPKAPLTKTGNYALELQRRGRALAAADSDRLLARLLEDQKRASAAMSNSAA